MSPIKKSSVNFSAVCVYCLDIRYDCDVTCVVEVAVFGNSGVDAGCFFLPILAQGIEIL